MVNDNNFLLMAVDDAGTAVDCLDGHPMLHVYFFTGSVNCTSRKISITPMFIISVTERAVSLLL